MDNQRNVPLNADTNSDQGHASVNIEKLKTDIINNASAYAETGTKTHKDVDGRDPFEKAEYDWWEKQGTYEGNSWSVALWAYMDNTWKLLATKVELKPYGHSEMTSYSIRRENDPSFPGFQIYQEFSTDMYHPAKVEDLVYLDRVMKGLRGL